MSCVIAASACGSAGNDWRFGMDFMCHIVTYSVKNKTRTLSADPASLI